MLQISLRRVKALKPLSLQIFALQSSHLSTAAEPSWKYRNPPRVPNLVGGSFIDSQSVESIDVLNPATQEVVSQVPLTTNEEFKAAVSSAKQAFPAWRNTPITTRQRVMLKLQELIRRDMDKLAMNITTEQGKTLKDAQGDVFRGLEVVEHACGMATLQMGEFVPNVSNGIDTYSLREPLGVCAGICPFNFPAMIPLWMFPVAVTCGNTFILKPSEKDPGASIMLAELAMEAGIPDGVLNIVHGTNDIVNAICDDEDIRAISFVGSNTAGMHIYSRASAKGKRVQSNMGAKNHGIVMPDANVDATLNALVAAGFGAAGQRCMALSTVVFVGSPKEWEDKLVERAKALKVNVGTDPEADLGPVISKQAKERILKLIEVGVNSGAKLLLDGRNITIAEVNEEDYDVPLGFISGTTHKVAAAVSASREPSQPILIGVESSSSHNDCVSLDAKDTLSDVSPSPAVGGTPISSILPMTSPYDGPKDANKAPTSSRGNPSETIADVHPPQKESAELVIDQEGIIDSTLGGLNDIPVSVASPDSFSIGYISEKMKDLPLPVEALALFDVLHPDVAHSPYSDLGYPPGGQGFEESSAIQHLSDPPSLVLSNSMVASKVASARASFNPSGDLIPWRGFQISSPSQENLERLLARFPHILDRLIIKIASTQTFFLDQLASLVLGLHTLSLYSLRAEDLKKFSDDVNDLEAVGVDMSPFHVRLDLLKSSFNLVLLRSEVAVRKCEYDSFSVQLSELDEAANKLKIQSQDLEDQLRDLNAKFQDVECQRRDLEVTTQQVRELKAVNLKVRDAAIADLEALAMPPLQFDMSAFRS